MYSELLFPQSLGGMDTGDRGIVRVGECSFTLLRQFVKLCGLRLEIFERSSKYSVGADLLTGLIHA